MLLVFAATYCQLYPARRVGAPNSYWFSGAACAPYSASFTATGAQAGKTLAVVLKKENGGLGQAQFDNIAVTIAPPGGTVIMIR